MFHNLPQPLLSRMKALEARDARDRTDGTPRMQRMRQIPPESGKFLALLAANAPPSTMLEVGTSAGYSALWITRACEVRGGKLTTFELLPEKIALAQETFRLAGVEALVELVSGDAREHLGGYAEVAFCFVDLEKELYAEIYDLVVPNLVSGGLLVADNAISHRHDLQALLDRIEIDPRLDSLVVPVGKGLLVCRKV